MIYFHGGFWAAGSKEGSLMSLLPWMEMGWTVVNVEYRLARVAPAPAAVEDCLCALRYVAAQAKTYNIDTTRLVVTGFTGPYTLPDDIESKTDHVVHICAGSGSVPNFAILKYALHQHPRLRHTFVYSNRTWDDVIFRKELQALAQAHADRLRLLHTLTREPEPQRHGRDVRAGRIGIELLREAIPDPSSCRVFACGPAITIWDRKAARESGVEPAPRFLETVLEGLKAIGVKNEQITRESYG